MSPSARELLKNIHIFQDLQDEDFDKLARIAKEERYPAGTILFRQGDPSGAFFIVRRGSVKIVKDMGTPSEKVLAVLRDGDFFGEMGVIEDSVRYATAVVAEDSFIIRIRKADFDNLMSVNPSIAMKIMVTVTRRYTRNFEEGIDPLAAAARQASPARKAKVVVGHSSSGGAGVSTVMANLAYCIASRTGGRKVILIDGSVQFGDLSVMVDVIPKHTLFHMSEEEEFSIEMLNGGYINSTRFGFDFIAAPLKPEQSEMVTADLFRVLIGLLETEYDYILLDTYTLMQEPILTLLELADEILYMMEADIPGMKNAKLWMDLLEALDFTKANVEFILTKYAEDGTCLSVSSIEKGLNVTINHVVPRDLQLVKECVNKGRLLAEHAPGSDVSKSIDTLADHVLRSEVKKEEPQESGSFFSSWVGRLKKRFNLG